jgi:hypothetical protein
MTFGRAPADRDSSSGGFGRGPAADDVDAVHAGGRPDGFGGHAAPDGFGGAPLHAGHTAGRPAVATTAAPSAAGAGLLRSAASDVERLRQRVGPAAQLIRGYGLGVDGLARELQAIVRRVDEAAGAGPGATAGAEIENLAGAVRTLTLELPPHLRDAPEVQDALATLSTASADLARAAGVTTSLEPTATLPALGDDEQAGLARRLLADASAT